MAETGGTLEMVVEKEEGATIRVTTTGIDMGVASKINTQQAKVLIEKLGTTELKIIINKSIDSRNQPRTMNKITGNTRQMVGTKDSNLCNKFKATNKLPMSSCRITTLSPRSLK